MKKGTYIKRTWIAGNTIEVQKTYSSRYGKKLERGGNMNRTRDAVKRYNERMGTRKLIRLVNANFKPGHLHVVLTYFKENRPTLAESKVYQAQFIRKLRKACRKSGTELKYISSPGIGERGAVHHHLLLNISDALLVQTLWEHGTARPTFLRADSDYSRLAVYLSGQNNKNNAHRWTGSKNLIRPQPTVEEVQASAWREPPKPIKGYMIDKNSLESDISPVTGVPYMFYRMVKIPPKSTAIAETGELLHGAAAIARLQAQNRKAVKAEWDRMRKARDEEQLQNPSKPEKT